MQVQLTASKSLVQVVVVCGGSLCLVEAHVFMALLMLPIMQMQSLGDLGRSVSHLVHRLRLPELPVTGLSH